MVHRFKSIWRLQGGYDVMDVGCEYFLVKFDLMEDKDKILLGGLWRLGGHYLAVKPWSPDSPCEEFFGLTLV
ncbi:hypothetical protein AHAS_Ahas12G0127500 [Arachis hypogaea]